LERASTEVDLVPVLDDLDAILGYRVDPAPQLFHPVSVDPARTRPEFLGVHEVWRADPVNGDGGVGETLRQGSGRSGVIEMDVRYDDPVKIVDAVALQSLEYVGDLALRAGLDQRRLLAAYDERSGDPVEAVHLRIDDQWVFHSLASPCG
jgi:hypothetical protein